MPADNAIDFRDLQGVLRFGHGRLEQAAFLLLKIRDRALARQWLAALPVTSAETVSPLPDHAVQVAFTADGLAELGLEQTVLEQFSLEFIDGMVTRNRSRRLGDTGSNAPQHWLWGGREETCPHVLLMLYALPGELDAWQQSLTDETFARAFVIQATLSTNTTVTREPFGFADGVSQPKIDWLREQTTDLHRRDAYSNLLALGEIVLGYPNEYGEYDARPLLSAAQHPEAEQLPEAEEQPQLKDLGRNGSYLVLRQMQQDVRGFWQFLDQAVGGDEQKRERLAEAMVGRSRDGTALVPMAEAPIAGISKETLAKNNFSFADDPKGLACPLAAHIRRSNPRTGDLPPGVKGGVKRLLTILGFAPHSREEDLVASTRFHRILRRGRQYGPQLTPEETLAADEPQQERGLHFICLSANIARQFEFVQNAWIANGKFAGLQDEDDPLLGNRQPLRHGRSTDNFSRPQSSGLRQCLSGIPQFVTVRGGAYFFLPGIQALKYLTCAPPDQE